MTQETRDTFFDYLIHINRVVQMSSIVSACPGTVMTKITNVATELADKIESGDATLGSLDLLSIGKDVAETLSANELNDFTQSMMQNAEICQICMARSSKVRNKMTATRSVDLGGMMSGMMSSLLGGNNQ